MPILEKKTDAEVTTVQLKTGRRSKRQVVWVGALTALLLGCGGGGGSSDGNNLKAVGSDSANFDCDGNCPNQNLTEAEVETIVRQAIASAQSLNLAANIAVLDRSGNVLAMYVMPGALSTTTINGQIGAVGGLEGAVVPATLAAISKAGTAAYLSSQGNAFSTRTASQIIQENFDPGETGQPGGPLFGVQFSQLPCSDVTVKSADTAGPRSLPLGLAADPGGIPLYKNGDLVGGIGVELDGLYSLDLDITNYDDDPEERIALTGGVGFEIPSDRSGDQIFVAGRSLRTADIEYGALAPLPVPLPNLDPASVVAVPPFFGGTIQAGVTYGTAASGFLRIPYRNSFATILVNGGGGQRYPTHAAPPLPGGEELKADEVDALLQSVFLTADRTRGAIRRPLDSHADVSIWVVDPQGNVLGMVRSNDAPVFGTDVALQKGRTATFYSSADAGDKLDQLGFGNYVGQARALLGPLALTGAYAFTDRAGGNLSRPFFPDGQNGKPNGPFSLPFPGSGPGNTWSPFNTGLQLDLILPAVVAPLAGTIPSSCTPQGVVQHRLANGIQIFPGSVPLYRGHTLIGGVGISGDGVDQDDFISFFGSSRPGLDFAGFHNLGDINYGFNSLPAIRSDNLTAEGARLRYINCPESPFVGSDDQTVCGGL